MRERERVRYIQIVAGLRNVGYILGKRKNEVITVLE